MVSGRAVFLDRDGVLAVPEFRDGRSFAPRRVVDFRLYEDAAASVARLKAAGFTTVVVTNQPDVGDGLVELSVVEEMHRIMAEALPVDAIEVVLPRPPRNLRLPQAEARDAGARRRAVRHRLPPQLHGRRPRQRHRGGTRRRLRDDFHRSGLHGVDLGAPDHKVASLTAAADIILAGA